MSIPANGFLWRQRKRHVREALARPGGVRQRVLTLIAKVDANHARQAERDRDMYAAQRERDIPTWPPPEELEP